MKLLSTLLSISFFVGMNVLRAQDFFGELSATKNFPAKESKYSFFVYGNFQQILSGSEFTKIEVKGQASRPFGKWTALGGIDTSLVFDNVVNDYYEFRPYLGVAFGLVFFNQLNVTQTLKPELRALKYFHNQESAIKTRVTYDLSAAYTFLKKEQKYWRLGTGVEIYILNQDRFKERFINSTEFSFKILRGISASKQFGIVYKYDWYNKKYSASSSNSNTICLEYDF